MNNGPDGPGYLPVGLLHDRLHQETPISLASLTPTLRPKNGKIKERTSVNDTVDYFFGLKTVV